MMTIPVAQWAAVTGLVESFLIGDFITKNAELLALLPKETHNE